MSSRSSPRVLRVLAAYKLVKAVVLTVVGIAALKLWTPDAAASAQDSLETFVLEGGHHVATAVAGRALELLNLTGPREVRQLAVAAFLYAALFVVQGVGLWLARRWAEYLTVGVTISFLPFEAAALWQRWTVPRAGSIILSLAVVAYLISQLRAQRASQPG